jgi:1-acyl-sn-glycerol-3-phosphate acyltransferase
MEFKMKRSNLQRILTFLMNSLTRVEFQNADHIPTQGGVVVATNHMSRLDIPLLFMTPTRLDITCLVTDKYKANPLFTFILNSAGAIWLDRTKADFAAFQVAVDALKGGACIGVAPEGTRSNTGQLLPGKAGTALLAMRAEVPVVPVALIGTENSMAEIKNFRRPHLIARYGAPFYIPKVERNNRSEAMQRYADEIMCRIAVLLPEKYHGYYANHPRIPELRAELGLNPA